MSSAGLYYDNFDQCKLLFTEWTEETTIKSLWFPEEEQAPFNFFKLKVDSILEANCSWHGHTRANKPYKQLTISVEFEKFATNFWVDKFAKRSS